MDEQKKGVIYARFSSHGQREESIEGQLRDCHEYAKKNGITVIAEYCDRALTATDDKRVNFRRLMHDSTAQQFQFVIAWKGDRLFRNRYDAAIYKHELKKHGIRVLYAKEQIPDGAEGIILEAVMEGVAEYYSANLSENIKRGNRESALKLLTVGQTVFGLRKAADGRFEHDPATAPAVLRAFRLYASGTPAQEIADALNAAGYRTTRGNEWHGSSVVKLLENEKYAGVYRYAGIVNENGIPPIVDRALFEDVQKMIDKRKRAPAAKPTNDGFLLTGKLFCGECGAMMTGDGGVAKSGKHYAYYTCQNRRKHQCKMHRANKQQTEDLIVGELAKIVHDDKMIATIADRFMAWQDKQEVDPEVAALQASEKDIARRHANIIKAIEDGVESSALRVRRSELEQQLDSIRTEIAHIQLGNPVITREQIVAFLISFREGDRNDAKWREFLVRTFLKAAYLYDDGRLLLEFNFSGRGSKKSVEIPRRTREDIFLNLTDSAPPNCANSKICVYAGRLFAVRN